MKGCQKCSFKMQKYVELSLQFKQFWFIGIWLIYHDFDGIKGWSVMSINFIQNAAVHRSLQLSLTYMKNYRWLLARKEFDYYAVCFVFEVFSFFNSVYMNFHCSSHYFHSSSHYHPNYLNCTLLVFQTFTICFCNNVIYLSMKISIAMAVMKHDVSRFSMI